MIHRVALSAALCLFVVSQVLAQDTTPPTIVNIQPAPGTVTALTSITVTFSEPVSGLDPSDFLIQGLAVAFPSGESDVYTFTFDQPPYGPVQIGWALESLIADFAGNPFNATAPSASWQYQLVDNTAPAIAGLFPAAGATVRSLETVEVTFSESVEGVQAGDLLVNGQPATNLTKLPGGPYVFGFPAPAAGTVNLSWATGHGITDIPGNVFPGGAWTYQVNPNATPGDLVITEILASNVSTNGLADEEREQVDWIEIYNRGSNAVNLAGWSLSDDPDVPGLWVFGGARVLNPGQYIIVFASGKDRRNPATTNRFHTNFQLGNAGEHLGLYSPDSPRVLVSGFAAFPEQRNDHSYGYDNAGNLRYFRTPTPGAANGASAITGITEDVHFNVERGHFTSGFDLHLSTTTPKAIIRVTTDGSEPTEANGIPYTNTFRITNTTMLRAAAFRTNMLPSRVGTHTYLFNVSAGIRSLPIISITTATNNLLGRTGIIGMEGGTRSGDGAFITNNPATDYHNPSMHGLAWEKPVSAEFIRLDGQPGFQVDCGIRVQGSDWQRPRTTPSSKFSYRLYFRSDYGEGRLDYPLFTNSTVTSFDQLVLRAGFNDNANPFIRDELTRRLSADMGQVASHGTLASLFVNGVHKGYYNPCERVHEEMLQEHHGGGEEWDVVGPSFAQSASGAGIIDGDRSNFGSLVQFVGSQPVTTPSVYQQVGQRLDLVNFVDYCLLNVYCGMGDWPANNWRAGKDRGPGGIWRFIIWDGEWAMGIYGRTVNRDTFAENGPGPDNSGLSSGNSEIANMYQRLYQNPEFRLLWADRIHKHYFNGGALTDRNITNHFFNLRNEMLGVLPGMAMDIPQIWVPVRRGTNMVQFQHYGLLRSSNAPSFNQHGGRVPRNFQLLMNTSNSTGGVVIYYTTNGTDPRVMFTGAAAPSAYAYDGASQLRLQQSTIVKARSLQGGTNWSALTEAHFDVGTIGIPIRITEINYNPLGGNGYEFLELQNVGAATLDLSGMYFEGVTLTFSAGTMLAPGATLVISSDADPAGFASRYTNVTVAARFSGSLNNGGERITLRDRAGNIIVTVDYDDDNGWPTAADGQGSSLEISDVFGDPDDPANWRASALHGTPGQLSAVPPIAAVRINEIMADNISAVANADTYPDWIELYNAGGAAVDLAGWSISDDGNTRKHVFAPGTSIAAGGYLVLWADSATNTTPGIHLGFALGRNGETISLYNTATQRVDAVSYGVQVSDLTVGRIAGEWQLNSPTPNAANVAAAFGGAGNLTINEWVANPSPGQSDWVELHNTGPAPVSLQGAYLGTPSLVQQITSLSYVPARGFAQIFLDENVGADHLDVRLPATGGTIVLYDSAAAEVTRVNYTAALEGVSQGRLPNGTGPVVTFVGSLSPGASNYAVSYNGPFINEVMARNRSAFTNGLSEVSDWVELYNPASTNVDLSGMSLSVGRAEPLEWIFPAGTVMTPNSFLLLACTDNRPASSNAESHLNIGRNLDGESGGVYLFNSRGQLVNFVEYGHQIEDRSIGRVSGIWRLSAAATPGAINSAAAVLGSANGVTINEWSAQSASGNDWFELFNSGANPVELSNLLVTDDPSLAGILKFRIAPLSFIGASDFVQFVADEDPASGRNHVNFSLSGGGESLRLYAANSNLLSAVYFGRQLASGSQGRLPDGGAEIVAFPHSASPGESNYLPPENVVINEVLTHASSPLEDAIELHNPSTEAANIGGWYLSDDSRNFKKIRVPDGTMLAAGAYRVLYENLFNDGSPTGFGLDRSRGNTLWLAQADPAGNLTGIRARARYSAALHNVSIGRYTTRVGTEFISMSQRTFGIDNPSTVAEFRGGAGLPNAYPRVGPIIVSEIMYYPPDIITPTNVLNNTDDEFIELHDLSGAGVALGGWKLASGVAYTFPAPAQLSAGGFVLVVGFDPVMDAVKLDAFRSKYGLSPATPIFGPYVGRLNNDGERIELLQPGDPDGSFIPSVLAEGIDYRDAVPWPGPAANGGGASIQRRVMSEYANEPLSWIAALPSPGAASNPPIAPLPVITQSPSSRTNPASFPVSFTVTATGNNLRYQWRFNGEAISGGTNATFAIASVEVDQAGSYDVIVSSAGGSAFSDVATLTVTAPPEITIGLGRVVVRPGTNVLFTVTATGPGPLTYEWRYNGVPIPGATTRTLSVTNVVLEDSGEYEVFVTNPNATVSSLGTLVVLVNPIYTLQPQSVVAFPGDTVTFRAAAYGSTPMGYRWRRSGVFIAAPNLPYFVLTNVQFTPTPISYAVAITNAAHIAPGILSATAFLNVVADADNDRMGDSWETNNGFNPNLAADASIDSDGDGMLNREEFVAGTDPNDDQSYLKVDELTLNSRRELKFLALANHNYTVQYTDDLSSGPWSNLTNVLIRATNRVEIVADTNAPPRRYYRLVTPFEP